MAQDESPYVPDPDDYRKVRGMDPAANWLLNRARRDYLPEDETPIPFLFELRGTERSEMLEILLQLLGFDPTFDPPQLPEELALIRPLSFFENLRDNPSPDAERLREYDDKRIVLSSPTIHEASGAIPAAVQPHAWPADTVFVAVIDDGIAFAHERFLAADGTTRIEAFWDMNRWYPPSFPLPNFIPLPPPLPPINLPYLPFPVAGELFKADIDALLAAGAVGEDDIYARSGLIDHGEHQHKSAAWRIAHGTHVLDLAAGYDPAGPIPNRPIIAVQLPTPVVARTTGELLDFHVALATYYILDRLHRLSVNTPPPPVVINTSFGYIAGAHDGLGPLESYLEDVTARAASPTRFVLPAGNAHLSRCHAVIDLVNQPTVAFDWIVQPDDRTHSVVHVWLPDLGGNRMTMTVVPPDGLQYQTADTPGPRVDILDGAGNVCGLLQFVPYGTRSLFYLAIMPTERAQPHPEPLAPAGQWRLRFDRIGSTGVVAHAWVQRDDSLYGYPQEGRQSHFDDPAYVRFAERRVFDLRGVEVTDDEDPAQVGTPSPVTRASLFNAIATGQSVITAGGFHERDLRLAGYSAGGPNTPPEAAALRKPDVLLPSEGSMAHPGVLAAGSRSGARVAMSGTSVAAPQLARYVADLLAAGLAGDRADVVQAATNPPPQLMPPAVSPVPDVPDPVNPPNRCGWGRLPRLDWPTVAARWEP